MKSKVLINYILLCFFWGTTWFAMKTSLNYGTPPILSAGLRFLIGSTALWLLFWYKKGTIPTNRTALSLYFQFAFFNFGISYTLTYWATQYIYSNLSAILWAGFPFVVGIFSHWMLPNEPFTPKKLISVGLGTVGVVIILLNSGSLGGNNVTKGIIVVIIAIVIAAYPNVYLKKNHDVVSPITLNAVSQSIAGILLMSISLVTESRAAIQWTGSNIIAILYLALIGSALSWLIYFWLFSHLSMMQISYVALFPPVIAALVGWVFLGEELNGIMILGALFVLSGALIINLRSRKRMPEEIAH